MALAIHNEDKCNKEKPYIFISYASENKDQVFKDVEQLRNMGANIWIDTQMKIGGNWKEQAFSAMECTKCVAIIFYVSEFSVTSENVLNELIYSKSEFVKMTHEDLPILPIQLESFGEKNNIMEWYRTKIIFKKIVTEYEKTGKYKFAFTIIKDFLDSGNIIIQNGVDVHDINYFEGLKRVLQNYEVFTEISNTKIIENNDNSKKMKNEKNELLQENTKTNNNINHGKLVVSKKEATKIKPKKETNNFISNEINYKLYEKAYSDNQSDLMLNVFEQVLKRHIDKIDEVVNTLTCASKTDYSLKENRNEEMKKYFRTCRNLEFENKKSICIGTSYGIEVKLKQIYKLLSICNESGDIFQVEGYEIPILKNTDNISIAKSPKVESKDDTLAQNSPSDSEEKIGVYAKKIFFEFFKNKKLSKQEIEEMLTQEYAKNNFKLGYPLLAKHREVGGRNRYWKDSVQINGQEYYICSEWYRNQRSALEQWKIQN